MPRALLPRPRALIERGELHPTGSVFTAAEIDLKTQHARALSRSATTEDDLTVMWTPDGENIEDVSVDLARGEGLGGDMLEDRASNCRPAQRSLCRGPKGESMFAGLIAGRATVHEGPNKGRYYIVAGVDRVREMLAVPRKYPIDVAPKYRTDDISVLKPVKPKPPVVAPEGETPPAGATTTGTPPAGTGTTGAGATGTGTTGGGGNQ